MSTGSSSSLFYNRDNDDDNDERYALEVVKRSKNLEWTLVLATLARDKKTLLNSSTLKHPTSCTTPGGKPWNLA